MNIVNFSDTFVPKAASLNLEMQVYIGYEVSVLKANAPAKINLFLNVIGKRADGYHLLESLFIPIPSLYDEIMVEHHDSLECKIDVEIAGVSPNIALVTARKLQEKFAITKGAKITIKKNIPIAAGLGGGSSDAATTLQLLCKLWNINASRQELVDIAVTIGADVPFFVDIPFAFQELGASDFKDSRFVMYEGYTPLAPLSPPTQFSNCFGYTNPAFIEGIGEIITPVKLDKELVILLVNPRVELATAEIFRIGVAEYSPKICFLPNSPRLLDMIYSGKNDLQPIAVKLAPVVQEVIDLLSGQQGCLVARMSGSGATCFGIFATIESAREAQKVIPQNWFNHLGV